MPYTIEKEAAYFYDRRLRDADPASFEILSSNFARDARAVYVHRKRFADADPASFEIILEREHNPNQFARDHRHVYRTNLPAILKDLNGATFRMLDRHYGCDEVSVFSFDEVRVLKNVSPKHFKALEEGYAVAGDQVFFRGQKIAGAKAATFRVIGPGMGALGKPCSLPLHIYLRFSVPEDVRAASLLVCREGRRVSP
jgi:DKNYY family